MFFVVYNFYTCPHKAILSYCYPSRDINRRHHRTEICYFNIVTHSISQIQNKKSPISIFVVRILFPQMILPLPIWTESLSICTDGCLSIGQVILELVILSTIFFRIFELPTAIEISFLYYSFSLSICLNGQDRKHHLEYH